MQLFTRIYLTYKFIFFYLLLHSTLIGIGAAKDVESKYLHPIIRPNKDKEFKGKEMKQMSSDTLGNYMRVPSSSLSPPPNYEMVSRETQTPGYYYYQHDTESITPPPAYINILSRNNSSNGNGGNEEAPRPLLYRLPSTSSSSYRS